VERDDGRLDHGLVDRWGGRRLNSPNDVVVKSDGTIWFTDPSYGIQKAGEGHPGELEYGDHVVFRFDPGTGGLDPVVLDVLMPNGLAFSPDERSSTSRTPPSSRRTGTPAGRAATPSTRTTSSTGAGRRRRTFVEVSPGLPDGIRVDAARQRLELLPGRRAGVLAGRGAVERVPVPEVVANLCFGGEDGTVLYITATTSLYRIATTTTDAVRRARGR
jgi:gluconolactonase